jgi:ferredoxin
MSSGGHVGRPNRAALKQGITMKVPYVDIGACTMCMGCVDLVPEVFQPNDMGYIAVIEMDVYPKAAIDEAIKYCPEDAIMWEEE